MQDVNTLMFMAVQKTYQCHDFLLMLRYTEKPNPPTVNLIYINVCVYIQVSEHDWRMTFLPQFKACVEAGSWSLMCSYNR